MTEDQDPIKKLPIEKEVESALLIVSPRQIKKRVIQDSHLAEVKITLGTETPDYYWTILLNGEYYAINLKKL